MDYRYIDMAHYPRKAHFAYFTGLAYPYVGLTANIDITQFLEKSKTEKWPFFLSVCYCVSQAANGIPEFRQRILDGKIIEFSRCQTSHTVALDDGTYGYCTLDSNVPFPAFLPYAQQAQAEAKQKGSIQEEEVLNKFFISTLPWVSYTALVQPVPCPADSNPRITWGKYFPQGSQILLPVSVLCHHGLVDGTHIGAFYRRLSQEMARLA